jgi:hypothetical protein
VVVVVLVHAPESKNSSGSRISQIVIIADQSKRLYLATLYNLEKGEEVMCENCGCGQEREKKEEKNEECCEEEKKPCCE